MRLKTFISFLLNKNWIKRNLLFFFFIFFNSLFIRTIVRLVFYLVFYMFQLAWCVNNLFIRLIILCVILFAFWTLNLTLWFNWLWWLVLKTFGLRVLAFRLRTAWFIRLHICFIFIILKFNCQLSIFWWVLSHGVIKLRLFFFFYHFS